MSLTLRTIWSSSVILIRAMTELSFHAVENPVFRCLIVDSRHFF